MLAAQDLVATAAITQARSSVVLVFVTIVLVGVTAYYAQTTARLLKETARAADAAERQAQAGAAAANAAARSAESARRQALLMLHPSLVIDHTKVSIYESVIPQYLGAVFTNVGSGEALAVEVRLDFAGMSRSPLPSQTHAPRGRMPVGQPHSLRFLIDDPELRSEWASSPRMPGLLSAAYDDVFGGRWTALWPVTICSGSPAEAEVGERTVVSPYASTEAAPPDEDTS